GESERDEAPERGIFHAELVPEIAIEAQMVVGGAEEEKRDQRTGNMREETERERRPGDELDERDIDHPIAAGLEARALEPGGEQGRSENARARIRKPAEEAAHRMRQQREAAPDAQQQLGIGRQRRKERAIHGESDTALSAAAQERNFAPPRHQDSQ